MTFDRQQFQNHMDSLEGNSKAAQQTICDQLKEDFLKMSWDERKEAFTILNEHNQKHETKLTIEGRLEGNDFRVRATTNQKILGGVFTQQQEAESNY